MIPSIFPGEPRKKQLTIGQRHFYINIFSDLGGLGHNIFTVRFSNTSIKISFEPKMKITKHMLNFEATA